MPVEVSLESILVFTDGLKEAVRAGVLASLQIVDVAVVGDAIDGALDQGIAEEGGEHHLGLRQDDAVGLHAGGSGVGHGVDEGTLFGGQDGLAFVSGDELGPLGLAFLRALVHVRGDGVGGVVSVEPFEGQLVDGGAYAQGLGLFAGAGEVSLVVSGGLEQFLRAGLVERLDAVIDDAFGDEVGHGCVIGCWWERSEKGHDGVGLIGAAALDGGHAHGRAHGEAGAGDRAVGVGLALARAGEVRASGRQFGEGAADDHEDLTAGGVELGRGRGRVDRQEDAFTARSLAEFTGCHLRGWLFLRRRRCGAHLRGRPRRRSPWPRAYSAGRAAGRRGRGRGRGAA
ncbi:MAG: hypothetical protein AN484_15395 [Aphanizomenon flos-aquae WA102]|uniref:Uncharacterized protein n=1 Tax=Aphanizomenon flos-aquae WA102 TaxID=1710896 RepID=A0A1B7X0P3_APHFL|nr:MAG: hypothetical protein AN484_15395 [Aphanizomenon flos-aquae WA102]